MGIRFECPNGHGLHVKAFLAGKRGVCPKCGVKLVVPGGLGESRQRQGPTDNGASASELTTPEQTRMSSAVASPTAVDSASAIQTRTLVSRDGQSEMAGIGARKASVEEHVGGEVCWYVRLPSGQQFGPANAMTFATWVSQGRVSHDCLVWQEGWTDWRVASAVPECRTDRGSAGSDAAGGLVPEGVNSAIEPQQAETPPRILNASTSRVFGDHANNGETQPIKIETNRPLARRVNRKPIIVILLCLTCLLLAIPLVYVFLSS